MTDSEMEAGPPLPAGPSLRGEAVTVSDEFRSAAPLGPAITRQDLVGERRERNQIMGCGYPASQPAGFFWDQRLAEASLSSRS